MKSTGVVRKVDELGRIVLPISIRQIMDINEKDSLEIFTDENKIILQKYQPSCIFCNNADNIVYFSGKRVCEDCLEKIKEHVALCRERGLERSDFEREKKCVYASYIGDFDSTEDIAFALTSLEVSPTAISCSSLK